MRVAWALVFVAGCDWAFGLEKPPLDAPPEVDAPPDVPACWPFAPSNYDPCEEGFPTVAGAPLDINMTTAIDTASLPSYGDNLVLLHVPSLTVRAGVTWTITSGRPLIIVSDSTIDVLGTIIVAPSTILTSGCVANSSGMTNTNTSSGGGGGTFGELGGTGGSCSGGGTTAPGSINGSMKLVALRSGCPGGHSGDATGGLGIVLAGGVGGGAGGGALELSAKTALTVTGVIRANGAGGSAGDAKTPGACNNNPHNCTSGGGGGGSGGGLLLESTHVTVSGAVCAVGGGGGAGGNANGGSSSNPMRGNNGGMSSDCTGGSAGAGAGIAGGRGGDLAAPGPGTAANASGFDSGGGGGGSVGRIHIAAGDGAPTLAGLIAPAPK